MLFQSWLSFYLRKKSRAAVQYIVRVPRSYAWRISMWTVTTTCCGPRTLRNKPGRGRRKKLLSLLFLWVSRSNYTALIWLWGELSQIRIINVQFKKFVSYTKLFRTNWDFERTCYKVICSIIWSCVVQYITPLWHPTGLYWCFNLLLSFYHKGDIFYYIY